MKPSRSYSYFLQTVTSIALNFQPLVGVKRGKSVGVTPLSKLVAYTGNGYTNWLVVMRTQLITGHFFLYSDSGRSAAQDLQESSQKLSCVSNTSA